jgi:hypothetical protein
MALPPAEAPGELFADYNPGNSSDLFAPPYIRGLPQSEQAVAAWKAQNSNIGWDEIEKSRMPPEWRDPSAMSSGDGMYGGPIPLNQRHGDPRGTVDPLALIAAAQGGHYDIDARRNAIAERLASNNQLKSAFEQGQVQKATDPIALIDPMAMYRWPYSGGEA